MLLNSCSSPYITISLKFLPQVACDVLQKGVESPSRVIRTSLELASKIKEVFLAISSMPFAWQSVVFSIAIISQFNAILIDNSANRRVSSAEPRGSLKI